MKIRRAQERGVANYDWLNSRHSFSFGDYFDPQHRGHGPLRVINDDRVSPGAGFPPHAHADMEIISYVVEGGLAHKDSIGSGSTIVPGEVQRMSAGRGIRHSEYNASDSDPVRFLQIWVVPEKRGLEASYEQKHFFKGKEDCGHFKLVGSREGRHGSVVIHQDLDFYAGRFNGDDSAELQIAAGRLGWVQIVKGGITVNGEEVGEGDGIALDLSENDKILKFSAAKHAEVLVFDMVATTY